MSEKEFIRKVGENVRRIRKAKGILQVDLASMCNFEKPNMRRIEAGTSNLTLKTLYALAKSLDVSVEDLVQVK